MRVLIVAAIDKNFGIGKEGGLPWPKIKSDLKRFKELTWGLPIIMGRKTYESIGKPLPGRNNIVLSRTKNFKDVINASSFEEAFLKAEEIATENKNYQVAFIGGNGIYKKALPYATDLHITWVSGVYECDTFFPKWNQEHWKRAIEVKGGQGDEPVSTVYIHYIRQTLLH